MITFGWIVAGGMTVIAIIFAFQIWQLIGQVDRADDEFAAMVQTKNATIESYHDRLDDAIKGQEYLQLQLDFLHSMAGEHLQGLRFYMQKYGLDEEQRWEPTDLNTTLTSDESDEPTL